MKSLIGILLLFSFLYLSNSAKTSPSQHFSEDDFANFERKLLSSQKKDGSFFGLKNTFYAVSSLSQLKKEIPSKNEICDLYDGSKIIDVETAFYVLSIHEKLGCKKSVTDKASQIITSSLEGSYSLSDIHFGISGAFLLKDKKVPESTLISSLSKLIEFGEDDGTFRSNENDELGSNYNTGLAIQTLALAASKMKLPKNIISEIETIFENVEGISGEAEDNKYFYKDEDPSYGVLKVTSNLFSGINRLSQVLKKQVKEITEDQIVGLTEFFVSNKGQASPEGIYYVLQGYHAISTNQIASPLIVSLVNKAISLGSKDFVQVAVTDINGKFATKAKVVILKATANDADKKVLITNQELSVRKDQPHIYETNFLAIKPEPKLYTFEVRVVPENKKFISVESTKLQLQIVGSVSIDELTFNVADSKDESDVLEGNSFSIQHPKSLSQVVKVESFQHLFLNFKIMSSGKPFYPQQVFLSFIKVENQQEVLKVVKPKGSQYSIHISAEEEFQSLGSGEYEVHLLVGDSFIDNSFDWFIGKIQLSLSNPSTPQPDPFSPKPEIKHMFRPAEKRPAKAVSLGFTAAALFPLAILLIGLLANGANLGNFPRGIGFIYALGFQGGIGAILSLYALYWFKLTMVETLLYLGAFSIPTVFFGIKTLNSLGETSGSKQKHE